MEDPKSCRQQKQVKHMKTNIYPKNYFSPYDDLSEIEEDPMEVKADKQAAQIIEQLQKSIQNGKINDFRSMYYKLSSLAELEFVELLEYTYKLEENK